MDNRLWKFLLAALLLQLSFQSALACRDRRLLAGEVPVYFGYDESAKDGPAYWGSLNPPHWTTCSAGKFQSPIALSSKDSTPGTHLDALKFRYKRQDVNATLLWKDEAIEIDVNRQWSSLSLEGEKYRFHDIHFHAPSEHTIDGVSAALELHLVYANKKGEVRAVLGVLYNVGNEEDEFLHQFIQHLPKLGSHVPTMVTSVNMRPLALEIIAKPYWRYEGSLTTPPCAEDVVWSVVKEVRTVSQEQYQLFKEASPRLNARPVQNLHDRKVYIWDSQ